MGPGLDGHQRPALSDEEWARVDSLYSDLFASLQLAVYLLLTDRPAEKAAEALYVFLEPFAHLVLAVDRETGEVSICSDWWMWKAIESELSGLTERAGSLGRAGRMIDALVEGLLGLGDVLGGEWQFRQSFAGGVEWMVVTHKGAQGTRRWEVERS